MLLFVGWALVRTVLRLVTLWHRHHVRTDVPVFLTCVALTLLLAGTLRNASARPRGHKCPPYGIGVDMRRVLVSAASENITREVLGRLKKQPSAQQAAARLAEVIMNQRRTNGE